MLIEYWSYDSVNADGTFGMPPDPSQGAVEVSSGLRTSGGHHANTPSTQVDGMWMSVSTGRLPDGTMHGVTIYFADEAEMSEFEQTRKHGHDHRTPPDDSDDPTTAADWWKKQ